MKQLIRIFSDFYIVKKRRKAPRKKNNDYLLNKEKARVLISSRLVFFAQRYNVSYGRVSIRDQKTRWGSCSQKANLNFNYRLIHLPDDLRDYIIVHELCHLIELNHGENFWRLVAQTFPNHRELRQRLRKVRMTN